MAHCATVRLMTTDDLITSTQAGALLGKSGRTVQRMADAGSIPFAQRLPGPNGAYLFRRADVLELRDALQSKTSERVSE
jgi:excisionase family DNA binding protein